MLNQIPVHTHNSHATTFKNGYEINGYRYQKILHLMCSMGALQSLAFIDNLILLNNLRNFFLVFIASI